MKPSCFDSQQQFDAWLQMYRTCCWAKDINFCQDCTASYAARMRTCGRCDHPEVEVGVEIIEPPSKPKGRPREFREIIRV